MDGTTALIIIVVIFAVVALVAIWRYRGRIKIALGAGPDGASLNVDGENQPAAAPADTPAAQPAAPQGGARIADAEAGKNISARDETGAGASVERAKAKTGSITATSKAPPTPKA